MKLLSLDFMFLNNVENSGIEHSVSEQEHHRIL